MERVKELIDEKYFKKNTGFAQRTKSDETDELEQLMTDEQESIT